MSMISDIHDISLIYKSSFRLYENTITVFSFFLYPNPLKLSATKTGQFPFSEK